MFKKVFSKLPKKSSKGSENREQGGNSRSHGVVATSKNSDVVVNQPGSSKTGNSSSTLN
jgi:serine/threonine-protein phosphatase 2A regulatory subunit B'